VAIGTGGEDEVSTRTKFGPVGACGRRRKLFIRAITGAAFTSFFVLAAALESCRSTSGFPLRQIAIISASATSWAVIAALIDHHAPGEEIDDDSHVEPTFRSPDIRKDSDPIAVWGGRVEGAVERWERRRRPAVHPDQSDQAAGDAVADGQ
jgi:hypothetical protein